MDIYVVLFCVILTLLGFPSYTVSEHCICGINDTYGRLSGNNHDCVEITPEEIGTGTTCYFKHGNDLCAKITCSSNPSSSIQVDCIGKNWSFPESLPCQEENTDTTTPSSTIKSTTGNTSTGEEGNTTTTVSTTTTTTPNATENTTTTTTAQNNSTTTTVRTTETTTKAPPTTSSNSNSTNTTNTESTSPNTSTDDNVTSKTAEASQDDNTVIYASASAGIFIVIIIVIVIVLLVRRRRKTQKDESHGIKRQPHGAISNNSYHNAAMNDNAIPMNDLTRTASENRYTDIYDDKAMAIDTFDGNYNTVALPSESKNEYGNIKPVAEPFVDNTYSHISNPNHLDMGTMYSHIGSALGHHQEKQPDFVGDTYAHIGQGNGNAAANGKNKQDTLVSDDTYSHIGKNATVPKTTKKTAEVDDTYSHLGQNVNQHPKTPPNADVDATYKTLSSSTNGVGTQNIPNHRIDDDNDDDSEYNHLEFVTKSATKQNQFPRKENDTKLPDKNVKQNTAASNLYAQVVKKKNGKFGVDAGSKATNKVKANADNERGKHNKFVVKDDDANIAEETENEPTNHQYFVLEKHDRET